MSRYYEFTTSEENPHTAFSLGSPVHAGNRPTPFREVRGVRVDGEEITFMDEELVDKLDRIIRGNRSWLTGEIKLDCVEFAAGVHGIPILGPEDNPLRQTDASVSLDPLNKEEVGIINLGNWNGRQGGYVYDHSISAAHTFEAAQYLHKLGDEGPLCLSGLGEAMAMYGSEIAHPVILP